MGARGSMEQLRSPEGSIALCHVFADTLNLVLILSLSLGA